MNIYQNECVVQEQIQDIKQRIDEINSNYTSCKMQYSLLAKVLDSKKLNIVQNSDFLAQVFDLLDKQYLLLQEMFSGMKNLLGELELKKLIIDTKSKNAQKINEKMMNKFITQEKIISEQQKEIELLKAKLQNDGKSSQLKDTVCKNVNYATFRNLTPVHITTYEGHGNNTTQKQTKITQFINVIEHIKKQIQDTTSSNSQLKAIANKDDTEDDRRSSSRDFNGAEQIANEAMKIRKCEEEKAFRAGRENRVVPEKKFDLVHNPYTVDITKGENSDRKMKNCSFSVEKIQVQTPSSKLPQSDLKIESPMTTNLSNPLERSEVSSRALSASTKGTMERKTSNFTKQLLSSYYKQLDKFYKKENEIDKMSNVVENNNKSFQRAKTPANKIQGIPKTNSNLISLKEKVGK